MKGQNWRSYSLNNDPHQKCSTSNRLVAKITIELTSGEDFSEEEVKDPSRNQGSQKLHSAWSNQGPYDPQSNAVPLNQLSRLPKLPQTFAIYAITLLMYTVADPDPDLNHRGEGQLPHPNEYNSTLMSGRSGGAASTYIIYNYCD